MLDQPPNLTSNGSSVLLLDGLDVQPGDEHCELLPEWLLSGYLWITIGCGVLGNLLLSSTILRCRPRWKKDKHYCDLMVLLLHLSITDIATLCFVAPFEIKVLGTRDGLWNFIPGYCSVFTGLESMFGLVTVYLLVTLSLHAITAKGSCELGDDAESSVRVPVALVWILSVSLSIPAFCLSNTVLPRPNHQLCTSLNHQNEHRFLVHSCLAVFRVAIPVLLLLVTSFTSVIRLCDDTQASDTARRHLLRISLVLSVSYFALSLHRAMFTVLHVFVTSSTATLRGPDVFREPPLANVATSPVATLAFSMVHYALAALRPILCFVGSRHVSVWCCRGTRRNWPS